MKCVIFLRGINVGGIKVPMADLRQVLSGLGLRQVKTYLQTGNIVCQTSLSLSNLKSQLEVALGKRFKYQASALVYDFDYLAGVVKNYPFTTRPGWHSYCLFCADQSVTQAIISQANDLDDQLLVAAGSKVVYWQVKIGQTLNNSFAKVTAKTKFRAVTTNRNLNTLQKMVDQK